MAQDTTVCFLLYLLLLICHNSNSSAFSLREVLDKNSDLSDYPSRDQLEKKIKREIDGFLTRESKSSKFVKNVSDNFHKYTYPRSAKGFNYLLLHGWGARGMPFNVLYTPNIHQQKIMKATPRQTEEGKIRKKEKSIPEIYDLLLGYEKSSLKKSGNAMKKNLKGRKYYSLIPQLFVSYGW